MPMNLKFKLIAPSVVVVCAADMATTPALGSYVALPFFALPSR